MQTKLEGPEMLIFRTLQLVFLLFYFVSASVASADRVGDAIMKYDQTVEKMTDAFSSLPQDPNDISWVTKKIQVMWDVDQFTRNFLNTPFQEGYSARETADFKTLFLPRLSRTDLRNTKDLKSLLKIYPWFKISIFGKKTDSNAWLLVQHADHDPDFQKAILKILEGLYPSAETKAANYAYLFDRVAASWNDPSKRTLQRYGTQGYCTGVGTWKPLPSEDELNLDKRRSSVGLESEADYIARFKDICTEDQTPP